MNASLDSSNGDVPIEWLEDNNISKAYDADSVNSLKSNVGTNFNSSYEPENIFRRSHFDDEETIETTPTTMQEYGLVEGNTFTSHSELQSQILSWGKNIGIVNLVMATSRKNKRSQQSDSISDSSEIDLLNFPYEYYVFMCSKKVHNGCDCGFRIRYKYSKPTKTIVISSICVPTDEFHKHGDTKNNSSSKRFVYSVKDLTQEEMLFLKEIAPERPNIQRLKTTLNRMFPNRLFDRHLLRRELTKGLDCYLGSDMNSATKLMQYGDQLIRNGGVFEKRACAVSLKLTSIHMQHHLEKKLNDVYGKRFVSIDTTFNITCHTMKVMPYVAVDCLCKNCPVGYSFMEVENSKDIVEGFRVLNVGTTGMYVGCDNGTAIICALKDLGMHPAHDGWHFHRSGKYASKDMGQQKNAFLSDLYKVIYHDFHENEDVDDYIRMMMRTYNVNEKMNSFLIGLWNCRQNLCKTYVAENFVLSFGKGAQVRSEQFNSSMKRSIQDVMTNWKMFEFTNHIDYLRRSYESSCLKELEKLIEEGKMICDKITKKVEHSVVNANYYNILPGSHQTYDKNRKLAGMLHYVEAKVAKKKRLHLIFVPNDRNLHPSCTCRGFKSTEVPCAHIARVFFEESMKDRNIFDKNTFAPYWHIDKHPLYLMAKGNESDESFVGKTTGENLLQPIQKKDIQEIIVPQSLNTRRGILHGLCQEIIEHGIQGNDNFQQTFKELETIKWNVTGCGDKRKSVSNQYDTITNREVIVPRPPKIAKGHKNEGYKIRHTYGKFVDDNQGLKIEKAAEGINEEDIDVNDM